LNSDSDSDSDYALKFDSRLEILYFPAFLHEFVMNLSLLRCPFSVPLLIAIKWNI